ncbi:hypothetical protein BDW62DRAFT_203993 [Aspergillus aurantiobrunneus]
MDFNFTNSDVCSATAVPTMSPTRESSPSRQRPKCNHCETIHEEREHLRFMVQEIRKWHEVGRVQNAPPTLATSNIQPTQPPPVIDLTTETDGPLSLPQPEDPLLALNRLLEPKREAKHEPDIEPETTTQAQVASIQPAPIEPPLMSGAVATPAWPFTPLPDFNDPGFHAALNPGRPSSSVIAGPSSAVLAPALPAFSAPPSTPTFEPAVPGYVWTGSAWHGPVWTCALPRGSTSALGGDLMNEFR